MKEALVIGNGSAGLLLSLTLRKVGFNVSILYRDSEYNEDSALICPEITTRFFESLSPGILDRLILAGARLLTHDDLLRMKFPEKEFQTSSSGSFLFVSRNVLLDELTNVARSKGINFVSTLVEGLIIQSDEVTGVQTSQGEMYGDFVFDCTGSTAARERWLSQTTYNEKIHYTDIEEDIFQRFFSAPFPSPLIIRSLPGSRGGIYPVEGNRFVVNISCSAGTQSLESIDIFATNFLHMIGGSEIVKTSTPQSEWKKLTRRSFKTNFYEQNERLKNFFPIGDGVLSSHPVYGRGISLCVLQLSKLNKDSQLSEALYEGYRLAEGKWKEVAGEKNSLVTAPIKKWVLSLLEKEPVAYERYLDFFQLRCTPLKLSWELLLTSLRSFRRK